MTRPHLFSPIRIGSIEVENRVVLAPVDVGLHGPNGEVTDRYIDFLLDRAHGGTGLLITEFTSVVPEKRVITTSVWDDRFIPGLARIADAVHKAEEAVRELFLAWLFMVFPKPSLRKLKVAFKQCNKSRD